MNIHSTADWQQKQKHILESALSVFVKNGIHASTMQQIAKAAKVATGSLYNYFPNKEGLINALYLSIEQEVIDYVLEGYDKTQPIKARYTHLMYQAIDFMLRFPDKFRFKSQYAYSPSVRPVYVDSKETWDKDVFVEMFHDAQRQNLIKPLADEDIYYFCYGAVSSLIYAHLYHGKTMNESQIRQLIELIWDALRLENDKT